MDSPPPVRIELYWTAARECPFVNWLDGLRDRVARAKIRVQIDRLTLGNFGKCRFLKNGVGELKVAWGPGYRVYFAMVAQKTVLLLCGGDKSTQQADIARAFKYWADLQERQHGQST